MMNLTKNQLHTLRHMLGINTPNDRQPKPYRNYAAVPPGDKEFAELENLGAVSCYRRAGSLGSRYDFFQCTDAGRAAAMKSHRTIRKSRPKRMYAKFLDISDCCADLTFREFLTSPEFAETRRCV